jgi:general secretion pathway protein G
MKKRRSFTLLEIMIVIFLIGIIGSVIGYNMKGSLEKGKAFRTEQAMRQIDDSLSLLLAEGRTNKEEIEEQLAVALEKTGLFKKPEEIAKDGWGNEFRVNVSEKDQTITVYSKKYDDWCKKNQK